MEWDAERITFFVDGREYFTFENEKTGEEAWPFDQDHYLILSLAVVGDWCGQKGVDEAASLSGTRWITSGFTRSRAT